MQPGPLLTPGYFSPVGVLSAFGQRDLLRVGGHIASQCHIDIAVCEVSPATGVGATGSSRISY